MSDLERDWKMWRGNIPMGRLAHYCYDWDFLPVDENSPEFDGCHCFKPEERGSRQQASGGRAVTSEQAYTFLALLDHAVGRGEMTREQACALSDALSAARTKADCWDMMRAKLDQDVRNARAEGGKG